MEINFHSRTNGGHSMFLMRKIVIMTFFFIIMIMFFFCFNSLTRVPAFVHIDIYWSLVLCADERYQRSLGSICQINEFHNALTKFSVKMEVDYRSWMRGRLHTESFAICEFWPWWFHLMRPPLAIVKVLSRDFPCWILNRAITISK